MPLKGLLGRLTGRAAQAAATDGAPQARFETLQVELASDDDAQRLGAIRALEALARDDATLRWPVMEVLVSHVRERRPVGPVDSEPLPGDVQAVLAALGRRPGADDERLPLGLFQVDLRGGDLTGADLRRADFSRSFLQEVDFVGSRLDEANFQEAYLDGAKMLAVQLAGANLLAADLKGTDLEGAVLDGANLTEAGLEGANLQNATLRGADLTEAALDGARLEGADLSEAAGLTEEQLAVAVTDVKTVLPQP